jgi:hypothetical protein
MGSESILNKGAQVVEEQWETKADLHIQQTIKAKGMVEARSKEDVEVLKVGVETRRGCGILRAAP